MLELSIFVGVGLRDVKYRKRCYTNTLPIELNKAFFCFDFLGSWQPYLFRFWVNLANLTTVYCEFNNQNGDAKVINKII